MWNKNLEKAKQDIYVYRSCLAYPSGNWRYPVISWPLTLRKYVSITQKLWGGVWESCIDLI